MNIAAQMIPPKQAKMIRPLSTPNFSCTGIIKSIKRINSGKIRRHIRISSVRSDGTFLMKFRINIRITETIQAQKQVNAQKYKIICDFNYVSPLMTNIWSVFLAAFSVIFEETEDEELYSICIEGMSKTVCILSLLNLDYQKKAVTVGLCKATSLFQINNANISVIHVQLYSGNFVAIKLKNGSIIRE